MNLKIKRCDLLDVLSSGIMFTSHIFIMHYLTDVFDGDSGFLNKKVLKTMLYTLISLSVYFLLVRKLIPIKEIKRQCYSDNIKK